MIRFYYSPDGLYKEHKDFVAAEANESFIVDEANNKIRLFDSKDFYFQSLSDIADEEHQNASIGISQKGAYLMKSEIDASIDLLDSRLAELEFNNSVMNDWSRIIQSVTYEENPEYSRVYLDADDKILFAVDTEGHIVIDEDTTNMETNSETANGLYVERLIDYLEGVFNQTNVLPQISLIEGNIAAFQDYNVINSSINTLENGIEELNRALNGVTTDRIGAIDVSINTLNSSINTAIANANSSIGNINTHISKTDTSVATINSSISALELHKGVVDGSINIINSSIVSINTSIGDVSTRLASANSSIGTINSSIGKLNASIGKIVDDLAQHVLDCDATHTEFSETWAAALLDVRNDIDDLNNRLSKLQFNSTFAWSETIDSVTYEENPEYRRVYLDADDKILYAVTVDGDIESTDLRRMETDDPDHDGSYISSLIRYLEGEYRDTGILPQESLMHDVESQSDETPTE